ncbi:HlyD family type I secretion periplasmic adaptor subunit [Salipiger bermudensis]|uniref:Membrane fusion protein (MFP) family protein n=1 Tax=Salipiger bermudensis (strain DSM 26914 / JCM 13377 / KCTC 12554 / HTCC2601) TaxID=314265 RepID=Q0FTY7_SALBH|nr:HlyD family type I secretion periplasmic adaptor subunit [Salipiger bermudensis]EAU47612.1 HlyD family secretion protein [Salipiger bermudensis HTCC2601]
MKRKKLDFVLHDGPSVKLARLAALVIVIAIAVIVVWSIFANVYEVAKAHGVIEPVDQIRPVESRQGGRVALVAVELGEYVEEGELLVSLSRSEVVSRRDELRAQIAGLEIETEMLDAQVSQRPADFSRWEDEFPTLVAREEASLEAALALLEVQRLEVKARIAQRTSDIAAVGDQLPLIAEELAMLERSQSVTEDLRSRNLATQQQADEQMQRLDGLRLRQQELRGERERATQNIEELEATLRRIDLDAVAEARSRIAEAQAQLRGLKAREAALEQEVVEVDIRAPVAGFVQSLPDESTGDVIDPGGVVATIVPGSGELRFAGRLAPRDIGFVRQDQPVRLKIDSYDFSRYGALEGRVVEISPTSTVDQRGESFYEVLVGIEQTFFRNADDGLDLMPGMTGEADIVTGAKTVFQYVWKPVYTNLDLALSER